MAYNYWEQQEIMARDTYEHPDTIWDLFDMIEEDTLRPDREYLDWHCDYYPEDTQEEEMAEYDWLHKEEGFAFNQDTPIGYPLTIHQYRLKKKFLSMDISVYGKTIDSLWKDQ